MLPPPAPISIICMVGISSGSPLPRLKRCMRATSDSAVTANSPCSVNTALAVVPPMSNASTSSWPVSRPHQAPASAPPAGPDSTKRIGTSAAVSTVAVPPVDSMMCTGAATPTRRSPSSSPRR